MIIHSTIFNIAPKRCQVFFDFFKKYFIPFFFTDFFIPFPATPFLLLKIMRGISPIPRLRREVARATIKMENKSDRQSGNNRLDFQGCFKYDLPYA